MDSYGFATKLDGFMFFSNESKWTFQQRRLQTSGCLKSGETYSKKRPCCLLADWKEDEMSHEFPNPTKSRMQWTKMPVGISKSDGLSSLPCFFNHRIAGFWCFQHMCSKKHPGQLELQMGDWYWPGAKFQVIPCLRSNILNILPSGYLTEPLEINIFV